jgi:hypothetical protein
VTNRQAAGAAQGDATGAEPRAAPTNDRFVLPSALLAFALASIVCAVTSEGFLTADALTHYLYAKYAFAEPYLLVDVWGRPLVTALYAVPAAAAGRLGVRLAALAVAIGCAFVSFRIARGQGLRRPALALLFTLAQPLVFLNSFAEMTELPFALFAGLAFWAYQSRRWWAAAALAGLLPLARPEGFEFLALAALGLVLNRKLLPLLLLPLPLLLWNHAGWLLFGREGSWWRWLIDHWPYSGRSTYPAGNALQFLFFLPAVVGPLVLPAMWVGAWKSLGSPRTPDPRTPSPPPSPGGKGSEGAGSAEAMRLASDILPLPPGGGGGEGVRGSGARHDAHLRWCRAMTALVPLSILVVHSLLYALGRMASFGEPRYLLVAAPFWAVLSARGWEWLADGLDWRRPLRWAALASVAPAMALVVHPVLPLRRPNHWVVAEHVARVYREQLAPTGCSRIVAAHPAVFYYLDVSPTDRSRVVEWQRDAVLRRPPGVALVWDPIYSARNASIARSLTVDEIEAAGWVRWAEIPFGGADKGYTRPTPDPAEQLSAGGNWVIFVSPAAAPPALPRSPSHP